MLAVCMNRAFMAMAGYSKDLLIEKLEITPSAPRARVEAQVVEAPFGPVPACRTSPGPRRM